MVSTYYTDLSQDQVISLYALLKLMRQLRITGVLRCRTVSAKPIALTANIYAVEKISYDPSKHAQDVEEAFNRAFGKRGYGLRGIG